MEGKSKKQSDGQRIGMETSTVRNLTDLLDGRIKLETADREEFVREMFAVIRQGIERDRIVKIKGLGTFKMVDVDARESVSVNSGERVLIGSHGKISFTPDATMKELVNRPFSQFETVVLNDGVVFQDEEQPDTEDAGFAERDVPEATPEAETDETSKASESSKTDVLDDLAQSSEPLESAEPVESSAPTKTNEPTETKEQAETVILEEKLPQAELHASTVLTESLESTPEKQTPQVVEGFISEESMDRGHKEEKAPQEEVEPIQLEPENTVPVASVKAEEDPTKVEESSAKLKEDSAKAESIKVDEKASRAAAKRNWRRFVGHTVGCLLLVGASAFGGFQYGLYYAEQELMPLQASSKASPHVAPTMPAQKNDTVIIKERTETDTLPKRPASPVSDHPKDLAPAKDQAETPSEKKVESAGAASQAYESDVRVRTGAYTIVGMKKVITAKAGETVKSISDRTLGPGMECYIEVFNHFQSSAKLAAGQKVKIPELALKKKNK